MGPAFPFVKYVLTPGGGMPAGNVDPLKFPAPLYQLRQHRRRRPPRPFRPHADAGDVDRMPGRFGDPLRPQVAGKFWQASRRPGNPWNMPGRIRPTPTAGDVPKHGKQNSRHPPRCPVNPEKHPPSYPQNDEFDPRRRRPVGRFGRPGDPVVGGRTPPPSPPPRRRASGVPPGGGAMDMARALRGGIKGNGGQCPPSSSTWKG